jgi:hypothetical protein
MLMGLGLSVYRAGGRRRCVETAATPAHVGGQGRRRLRWRRPAARLPTTSESHHDGRGSPKVASNDCGRAIPASLSASAAAVVTATVAVASARASPPASRPARTTSLDPGARPARAPLSGGASATRAPLPWAESGAGGTHSCGTMSATTTRPAASAASATPPGSLPRAADGWAGARAAAGAGAGAGAATHLFARCHSLSVTLVQPGSPAGGRALAVGGGAVGRSRAAAAPERRAARPRSPRRRRRASRFHQRWLAPSVLPERHRLTRRWAPSEARVGGVRRLSV